MIIPDVNLLLYAYDTTSRDHAKALKWWTDCMRGDELIGLPAVVAFSFVRMIANPRVFPTPMKAETALFHVREWLQQPNAIFIERTNRDRVFQLIERLGTAGNLVTDAQIAAIAIEEAATLHTADTDFARFPGLRTFNPLRRG